MTESKTILVVEDEVIIAKDLQQTLQRFGYRVPEIAVSADEAIAAVAKLAPDLVLMDIRLGGSMDGIATASVIRSQRDIPIIYLTAHADRQTTKRALQTDPAGYLLKPVRPDELSLAVEIALSRHEVQEESRRYRRLLSDRELWFSRMVQAMNAEVLAFDAEGRIAFCHPPPDPNNTPIGRSVSEFLSAEKQDRVAALERALTEAKADGRIVPGGVPDLDLPATGVTKVADGTALFIDKDRVVGGVVFVPSSR